VIDFFLQNSATTAFAFGILSAITLPIGALVGMFWTPKKIVVAALMAFGGGALLAALTLDIVGDALEMGEFLPLAVGGVLGSLLFVIFNDLINNRGGFLRKAATTLSYIKEKKTEQFKYIFEKLGRIHFFNQLPAEEMQNLVPYLLCRSFKKNDRIVKQGDPGDSLFIVEEGEVDVIDEIHKSKKIATLGPTEIFGEMALVTGEPRSASVVAKTEVRVWIIKKENFDRLLHFSPKLANQLKKIVSSRIKKLKIGSKKAESWMKTAIHNIDDKIELPTIDEIRATAEAHAGAPVAIWLGSLLDAIPGAMVIGASLINSHLSLALLAGLFLSNFPESLSSSIGMRQQSYSFNRIFWMWTFLMIITGVGAALGNLFLANASPQIFTLVEGMAFGAMLTVIAETMLPEAYYKGGAITGISTLFGFLAAIFFKTFE